MNHVSGGSNPTFTVEAEDAGTNRTNVKVNVTVSAGGKQFKGHARDRKDRTGKTVSVDIRSTASRSASRQGRVKVRTVPGETNTENNKQTYLAVFAK